MNWDLLRFFLTAQRAGSLAAAGRALGVDHTTVGRRLTALEESIGTSLMERRPDGLRLTAAGYELLSRALIIEADVREVERLVGTFDAGPEGGVQLATSGVLAEAFVIPLLPRLSAAWPRIDLSLIVARSTVDMHQREADLALRLYAGRGDLAAPDVVTVRIGDVRFGLYAAERYLVERPDPLHDLGEQAFIRHPRIPWEPGGVWLYERGLTAPGVLEVDDMPTARAACIDGLGLAVLPRFYTPEWTALRCLVDEVDRAALYLVVNPDLRRTPRVRAVLEWLRDGVPTRLAALERAALGPAEG